MNRTKHKTMYTLADGIQVYQLPDKSVIYDAARSEKYEFDPFPQTDLALISKSFSKQDSIYHKLSSYQIVKKQQSDFDQMLYERLEKLDNTISHDHITYNPTFKQICDKIRQAHAMRKVVFNYFGQTPCTPETATKRALLLGPIPQEILLLGDDDFVGIGAALLGHHVTIYDIDSILLDLYQQIANNYGLSITLRPFDLRKPIISDHHRQHDIIIADHMSNKENFIFLLSRAIPLLKEHGHIHLACKPDLALALQEVAHSMALPLQQQYHRLNRYYNAHLQRHTYESSHLIFMKTHNSKPLIPAHKHQLLPNMYETTTQSLRKASVFGVSNIKTIFAQQYHIEVLLNLIVQTLPSYEIQWKLIARHPIISVILTVFQQHHIVLVINKQAASFHMSCQPHNYHILEQILPVFAATLASSHSRLFPTNKIIKNEVPT